MTGRRPGSRTRRRGPLRAPRRDQCRRLESRRRCGRGRFRQLNVLVNNAGIVQAAPLKTADITRWQKVLDVNLTGAMRVSRPSSIR